MLMSLLENVRPDVVGTFISILIASIARNIVPDRKKKSLGQ